MSNNLFKMIKLKRAENDSSVREDGVCVGMREFEWCLKCVKLNANAKLSPTLSLSVSMPIFCSVFRMRVPPQNSYRWWLLVTHIHILVAKAVRSLSSLLRRHLRRRRRCRLYALLWVGYLERRAICRLVYKYINAEVAYARYNTDESTKWKKGVFALPIQMFFDDTFTKRKRKRNGEHDMARQDDG